MSMGLINSKMKPGQPAGDDEANEDQRHEAGESPQYEADEESGKVQDPNEPAGESEAEDPGETESPEDDDSEGGKPGEMNEQKFMFVVKSMLADEKSKIMPKIALAINNSKDVAGALSNAAYAVVAAADEKTGATLPDDMLATVAAETLGMVADIAEASGKDINPQIIAQATKDMLVRFLQENGDQQGAQAISQQDPSQVGAQLAQMGGGGQDGGQPAPQGAPQGAPQ